MEAEKGFGSEDFPPLNAQMVKSSGAKGVLISVDEPAIADVNNGSSSSSVIESKEGFGANPNPRNWRSIFPNPRAVTTQPSMKYTPPVEINGKVQVAAQTDSFSAGLRKCESMVVGFFVGKRLSFAAVQAAADKLWKFKQEVSIKLYGDCAFIFEFIDDEDRKLVLDTGSFYISKSLFILRPWTQLLEKSVSEIKSVPIWVMIYGVPLHMWNNEGLGLISSYLGKPLFADEFTIKQNRLAYARVCIEVDVEFSYPTCIPLLIDGKIAMDLPVEYPWKPLKCNVCMVFGHTANSCAKKLKSRWTPKKICKPAQVEVVMEERLSQGSLVMGEENDDNCHKIINREMDEATMDSGAQNTLVSSSKEMAGGIDVLDNQDKSVQSNSKSPNKNTSCGTSEVAKGMHKKSECGVSEVENCETSAQGEWIEAKSKKSNKKIASPKKNPFIVYSDFKSESRFPIDRRRELSGALTPSKGRASTKDHEDNNESLEESLEDKLNKLERDSKMKERELHRLHWDGKPGIANGKEQLGRGCRTQPRK